MIWLQNLFIVCHDFIISYKLFWDFDTFEKKERAVFQNNLFSVKFIFSDTNIK